ncbi:GNAT family N-acetyltransferase [Salinigranum rubrum]|uniref:GNAT family N-acetyltransferase n=1 Tax=Salinigranum rubrum TaxID=755307 RepID=A0A2I8VI78_9EURY|nr:GNAT family N-acetyltransferase [Salinigranum rubrum]AUV81643.1 GNAT family N-acetyltransferase [Salinigranum rubrum]
MSRDTIVHPDHRRRGLFTASTEYSLDQYADSDVAFVFSHSNANSRPGYRKMGWQYAAWQVTRYRPRDTTAFVAHRLGRDKRFASPLPGVATDLYVAARDRLRRTGEEFEVSATDGVTIDTLASLHDRPSGRPDGVHPVFDEATLRYFLGSPEFARPRTYVARAHGEVVAALVVCHRRFHGTNWLSVAHVAPLAGGDRWEGALSTLLGHAIADAPDVDAYRVAIPFPESVLASHGFLSDRHPPMSLLEPPRLKLGIRPLDGNWSLGGASLLDAEPLWTLSG